MEAPSGSYWACRPGNASYDAHIAGKVAEFAAWAAAEPRISGMCPVRSKATMLAGPCLHATGWRCVLQWHYNNRCSLQGVDYQCGCATPQAACKPVGAPGTPSYW